MALIPSYREFLRLEFLRRHEKNAKYSMRAFATDIGLSPAMLSEILSFKKGLSPKRAHAVAPKLRLGLVESKVFINLVIVKESKHPKEREAAQMQLEVLTKAKFHIFNNEKYNKMVDWISYSVLEATRLSDFKSSYSWLAKRMGVAEARIVLTVSRLIELDMLRIDANGDWVSTFHLLEFDIKEMSKQAFEKNVVIPLLGKHLERVGTKEPRRGLISMTVMALNSEKIAEINKKIIAFEEALIKEYDLVGESKDSIYSFSTQLIPIDNP